MEGSTQATQAVSDFTTPKDIPNTSVTCSSWFRDASAHQTDPSAEACVSKMHSSAERLPHYRAHDDTAYHTSFWVKGNGAVSALVKCGHGKSSSLTGSLTLRGTCDSLHASGQKLELEPGRNCAARALQSGYRHRRYRHRPRVTSRRRRCSKHSASKPFRRPTNGSLRERGTHVSRNKACSPPRGRDRIWGTVWCSLALQPLHHEVEPYPLPRDSASVQLNLFCVKKP